MFQVHPLYAEDFQHLYNRPDDELAWIGVVAQSADADPGFPCRVSLRHARIGERVLLMNYEHQPADTPFRARHAIYVIDGVATAQPALGELPPTLRQSGLLSVRAFDADGMLVTAQVTPGAQAADLFTAMLADTRVAELHAHFAAYGCFAARITRA